MTLKERVLADPFFPKTPKDLREKVELHGFETVNSSGQAEIRYIYSKFDDGEAYYYFYFDADRNPGQIFPAHLIVGGGATYNNNSV